MREKLSVVYFSPGWPLADYPNGIVTYIKNLQDGFPEQIDFKILAQQTKSTFSDHNVLIKGDSEGNKSLYDKLIEKIFRKLNLDECLFNKRSFNSAKLAVSALSKAEYVPDIIEVEESFGIAKYISNYVDYPIITRLHGPWFIHGPIMNRQHAPDFNVRVMKEGEAIRDSAGITSPSLDVLERVREFYGFELPDAEVIPNPVNSCPQEKRWSLNNQRSKPTVLFVGRFDLHKGADIALQAFRLLALENSDVQLVFVGPDRGVQVDGKLYNFDEYISAFIPEETVKKRIKFLGAQPHSKIEKLRASCQVTMVTSRYDNFPMSLLEAVSTGSPVVGVKVGGIQEILIHGHTGLLAEPENPESIAESMSLLLADQELMSKFSENAIADCELRFSPKVVAEQTLAFYNKVLSN
jgi:glycosyltransferase involved in cell wall biosynthesis